MSDKELLYMILNHLYEGKYEYCNIHRESLNRIAMKLLNLPIIGTIDNDPNAEELDTLIRICNITYNDTDHHLLPIEDGIYDLLVEKFRRNNDSKFQVGATVIDNLNQAHKTPVIIFEDNTDKKDVIFIDPDLKKRQEDGLFFNDIAYPDLRMNLSDFTTSYYHSQDQSLISKRKHDTEHNHPELVGTLDKCKFVTCREAAEHGVLNDPQVKILERDFFADHIKRGIINPNQVYTMTCELKYDGVSVEADCTDHVISARSRGDTGIGQASDMTPIFEGYPFPHVPEGFGTIGIKFEAIIQESDLQKFNERRGYNYKNGRTAIVGLTGSGDAYKYRDLITIVPLQVENRIYNSDIIQQDHIAEIEFLNEYYATKACPMRYVTIQGTYVELLFQIKMFLEDAEFARSYIPFMYDGIVVSYVDREVREALGRENFINKWSMAVKFNPLRKQTVFRGYKYTVGQDGSITPMIYYDPVEFYGTVHPKSSGQSYARFRELDLAIGDIINVEYVNDVMPYVSKPFNDWNEVGNPNPKEEFPHLCPICGSTLEISKSGKSVYCINPNCDGRTTSRMVNMFSKLNLSEFGEATILKIGARDLRTICEISKNHKFQDYGFGDGESLQLETEINKLFNQNIMDYDLFGALGFTSIASKTWQLIFSKIKLDDFICMIEFNNTEVQFELFLVDVLLQIKGLGRITVDTIIREYPYFKDDIVYAIKNFRIVRSFGSIKKKQIRATGIRNRELFAKLRDMGYDADDNAGVTKSTNILIVPYDGYNQGNKIKKAPEDCIIVAMDEFINNMDSYL